MHEVTVACRGCGREYSYQTMSVSTVGIAVCPSCGLRNGLDSPDEAFSVPAGDGEIAAASSRKE